METAKKTYTVEEFLRDKNIESIDDLFIIRKDPLTILTNMGVIIFNEALVLDNEHGKLLTLPDSGFKYNQSGSRENIHGKRFKEVYNAIFKDERLLLGHLYSLLLSATNDSNTYHSDSRRVMRRNSFPETLEARQNLMLGGYSPIDSVIILNNLTKRQVSLLQSIELNKRRVVEVLSNLEPYRGEEHSVYGKYVKVYDDVSYSKNIIHALSKIKSLVDGNIDYLRLNRHMGTKMNYMYGESMMFFTINETDTNLYVVMRDNFVKHSLRNTISSKLDKNYIYKIDMKTRENLDTLKNMLRKDFSYISIMMYFTGKEFKEVHPDEKTYTTYTIKTNNGKKEREITEPHQFIKDRNSPVNKILTDMYEHYSDKMYEKLFMTIEAKRREDTLDIDEFLNPKMRLEKASIIPLSSDTSYSYRKNKSALEAVEQIAGDFRLTDSSRYGQVLYHDKLISMDIKDFFPSITLENVIKATKFIFNDREMLDPEYIKYIKILIVNEKNELYVGNPLSGILSNFVMLPVWKDIRVKLSYLHISAYRYSDDMAFVGTLDAEDKHFRPTYIAKVINNVFAKYNLQMQINESKTKVQTGNRKRYLGLNISQRFTAGNVSNHVFVHPSRKYLNNIKAGLHQYFNGDMTDEEFNNLTGRIAYAINADSTLRIFHIIANSNNFFSESDNVEKSIRLFKSIRISKDVGHSRYHANYERYKEDYQKLRMHSHLYVDIMTVGGK